MKKIAIIGSGLAGLSAGIKILEQLPEARVSIYHMGHHIGGKAHSYRDQNGYNIDHGFHAIFSSYNRMLGLLERAGVDLEKTLISNKKITYYYEEDTKNLHSVGKLYDKNAVKYGYKNGYSPKENIQFSTFYTKNVNTLLLKKDIEEFDDICYTAWATSKGIPDNLLKKRSFRFAQDALFNWPHEVSCYITMKSLRLLQLSPEYYFVNGTYGENIIKPIVEYFKKLGGEIESYKKLVHIRHNNSKITGLEFESPDPEVHEYGKKHWGKEVVTLPETNEVLADFDAVIVTTPVDNFKELNKGDHVFWKGFPGIKNLLSVVTLSWQVWTKEAALPKLTTAINGLDEPMGMVIDYKHIVDEYKNNPEIGSVLEWVGQETQFENFTDEELKNRIIEAFLKIPKAKDPRKCKILYESFNRNSSNHERYLLTDPGTLRFRPFTSTLFSNMFLAGDWIRNEVDVPTMEGAICSGYTAADELINQVKMRKI